MCVLALLNAPSAAGGVTFGSLVEATGVPRAELARHVLSIANPKFRVLNKSSKVSTVWGGGKDGLFARRPSPAGLTLCVAPPPCRAATSKPLTCSP